MRGVKRNALVYLSEDRQSSWSDIVVKSMDSRDRLSGFESLLGSLSEL